MGEKVTIPVEFDVEDVRRCQSEGMAWPLRDYERKATDHVNTNAEGRIVFATKAAVLRFELPWEPSEQDVTDTVVVWGPWIGPTRYDTARTILKAARARGWDAIPRRIEGPASNG